LLAQYLLYVPVAFNPPTNTPVPATATPTDTPGPTPRPTRTPTPTKTPVQPTNTPTLPPPTYNDCQADPNPAAAPNYPVRILGIDKVAETVTLKNVSTSAIDLTGWNMCSVTGNQHHPIGGTLAAGETQTFVNSGRPIWNNSSPDPGALYNPEGQLVSYFNN
jgi:micrococcal nuclease